MVPLARTFSRHLLTKSGALFALAILTFLKPLPSAAEVVAIYADRMIDVRTGKVVGPALIIAEGDRIRYAGPRTQEALPSGAHRIDLGDHTLLPGLFDMHVHLSIGSAKVTSFAERVYAGSIDDTLQAADNARLTLLAGFTSVRSAGDNYFIDVALDKAIEKGVAVGPRIVPAGYQISMTGGHGDENGWPPGAFEYGPEQGIADGPEKLLRAVRYQIKHGARVIKMMVTGGVIGFGAIEVQQFSDEEMRTVVDEAGRNGLKVMAHAEALKGTIAAVRAGVASIEHGDRLDDEVIGLMKARGTYLVPTPLADVKNFTGFPDEWRLKGEELRKGSKASLEKAIRAGIKIAYGTDAGPVPHGQNARQFAMLVDSGMKSLAAIQAATIAAADLTGVSDRGALESGLLADIIAVPGNPLNDIRTLEQVDFVMKGGVVYREPAR